MKQILRMVLRNGALVWRSLGLPVPETLFKHLYKKGPFVMRLPAGQGSIRLMSWGNRVENEMFWRGWDGHEPKTRRWWARLALDADTILDIGANTGTFAFTAKGISPKATVHAFEPLARIADRMKQNIEISGLDVQVFQMAMADTPGELPIHDPGGPNAYSASLDANFLPGDKESYLVPVASIDSHCAAHGLTPDLIKIDVEGIEGRVLMGAEQTLRNARPNIICEWLGESEAHGSALTLLKKLGYATLDIDSQSLIDLSTARGFDDRNVLICPQDRLESLLQQKPLAR